MKNMVERTQIYVTGLLTEILPESLTYHNLDHTVTVVNGVSEIGEASRLTEEELLILQISAWFHDTGYCYTYEGHEEVSMSIAAAYLKAQRCAHNSVEQVKACIQATKMPQTPVNFLQQIICDADMAHLASEDYPLYEKRLRLEWEVKLNKFYTDTEWQQLNLNLLNNHNYFTEYGRKFWQGGKENNISRLIQDLSGAI